ncbi:hypothetical protein KY495_11705 [Massilia sp. PAMC28688]|uniref:hypothetical protein n=1 Tax=Massilia sp. PAMC28688 TaxID=2861283 RepID=UPI001C6384F2|nr:hypothetical protein [Massilia sp. PAMC28688]QYF95755.1 hypothetical protein KY495_11705 [Massilia sp. PAMC28688]
MRNVILILLAGCIATNLGCATKPETIEVKVPVMVKCVKAVPARPAFAALALPGDASEGEKVLALARDTLLHFKYESQLEAVIAGCV